MYRQFFCKSLFISLLSCSALTGCEMNAATGERQFTALMPASQEAQVGASEHQNILKEYNGLYNNAAVQAYVSKVGKKAAANTERADVNYQFFVLNSPVINAFALPGGYIYVTRGLLAIVNDEAELAGVLGHEIGHVTARHTAARYSQSVLASLGTSVLATAVGGGGELLNTGSELYLSSYSRGQESQADELGIRYISRAGYDPKAVSDFLNAMDGFDNTEAKIAGKDPAGFSYFQSHPQTADRVSQARAKASGYAASDVRNSNPYLSAINGMEFNGYDQNRLQHIRIVTAAAGDTVQSIASKMAVSKGQVERFRSLNALLDTANVVSGRQYKIVQ